MTEQDHRKIITDIINNWENGGFSRTFTISYVVKLRGADYPIVFKFVGHGVDDDLFQVDKEADMPGAIAEFVEHYGLTQVTLWDAYYLAREEISISRRKREND